MNDKLGQQIGTILGIIILAMFVSLIMVGWIRFILWALP